MADIFISWSSQDSDVVLPVIRRLEQHGLNVQQFEADPDAGNITEAVQRYIEEARLMVLFVSEKTNEAPWLKRETEWAAYRQAQLRNAAKDPSRTYVTKPMLTMIPVLIGKGVVLEKLNSFLAKNEDQKRLFIPPPAPKVANAAAAGEVQEAEELDAGPLSEAALQNIVLRICGTLGYPKPIVIPTILLAMNLKDAEPHLTDPVEQARIRDLCLEAGMPPFPDTLPKLLPRYKDKVDGFSPFPDEPPLKEIIEKALLPINLARPKEQPKLWLWWCRDVLFGPSGPDRTTAIGRIASGPSLVILDSISAGFARVKDQYMNLASIDTSGRQALLWIPPFTLHTAGFQRHIERLLAEPMRLEQEYQRWGVSGRDPHLFLDIATAPSLRAWLYGALRAFANEPTAAAAAGHTLHTHLKGPTGSPAGIAG